MLRLNADDHPVMKHMHRPDPKRPPEMQDKRMVVILPEAQYAEWLDVPPEHAMDFMQQYPAERLVATPEVPPPKAIKVRAERAAPPPTEPNLL